MLPTLLCSPTKSLRDIDGMAVEVETFQLKKIPKADSKKKKILKRYIMNKFPGRSNF